MKKEITLYLHMKPGDGLITKSNRQIINQESDLDNLQKKYVILTKSS